MEKDDPIGHLISLEQSEEVLETHAARAEAAILLDAIRQGKEGPEALLQLLREESRNAFTPYRLNGLALAICDAIRKGGGDPA